MFKSGWKEKYSIETIKLSRRLLIYSTLLFLSNGWDSFIYNIQYIKYTNILLLSFSFIVYIKMSKTIIDINK